MKTINSFRSKLFALTIALTASVASFAYEFEYVNDFHIDGFGYKIISVNTPDDGEGYVSLIEIADCKKDVVIPKYVSYGDRGFHVTTFGMGSVVFTNDASFVVESITIPKTTSVINKNALAGCPNLKTVVVDSENPYYDSRENCNAIITKSQNPYFTPNTLIAGCKTTIIPNSVAEIGDNAFYNCESLDIITIPRSVTKIGNSAFNACSSLSSIILSENLTAIGDWAFDDCNNLKEVICYALQPPTISQYTFSGISPTIYVPAESIEQYRAATGWKEFEIRYISWSSEECHEYKHVNLTALPHITGKLTYRLSTDDGSEPPYVDSVWILNTDKEPLQKFYAQSGDTIDLLSLELGHYILRVYIDGCILSRTFVYRPKWRYTWCDTWNVMWFDGMCFDETASTSQYRLGKDTIIGDYTYSKFTSRTSVRFTNDRKVYVYYEGFDDNDPYSEDLPTGEYLAYDFSAQVGDTLEVFSGVTYNTKTYKCVVYDVQTDPETNLRTIMLHPLRVVDGNGNVEVSSEEITWIEGVGSPNGFLINTPPPGGGLFTLLCAYKDDELKYTGSFYEHFGCEYNAGVVSDDLFPTLSGLQRTICREYYEQADNKTRMEQFTNLTTRTETGAPYIYCSPFLLREKDNKILIYSRSLDKDLVLYDFNLEVGDSLPMLYIDFFAEDNWIADRDMELWCVVDYHKDLEGNILPADTLIVTDVSMITLLDGKEYKKWTFNNGMKYVEGIGSFGNRQWSGDFFQLIANRAVPTSLQGEHLVCVSKNGKLLYQMDDAEMERLGTECLCDVEKKWSHTWCDTWNVLDLKYRTIKYTTKEDFETWRYYLAQDTIINNYTYTAVTRQTTKVPEGVYPFTIPEPEYVAAVRFTDDRKVYIYYDNTEYLLYDFNVQPGDELTVFAGINHYHSHHTNTIRVDEVERYPGIYPFGTEISLSVIPDFYGDIVPTCAGETKWVEGVGDLCGFITGADCGLSEYQTALLCAYKDGYTEYTTENEEYAEYGCEYNSGENKEYILTLPGLQRTSCTKTIGEDEYGTVWGSRSYLMQEIETATIDGKQYLLFGIDNNYDKLYLKLWLREENNKILLYSTAQKKDLVLYDFTLNVGDSLPRLYVDYDLSSVVDYDNDEWGLSPLVVTEVSTITLLDGKEYKKWTFDNGMQYVEGIGSFGTCYAHNDFYQLIANAPLSSDVYSQNLVCVSKNGKLLYQMDDAEMERLGTECLCDVEKKWTDTWCDTWNVLEHDRQYSGSGNYNEQTWRHYLAQDTIINGQTYTSVNCYWTLEESKVYRIALVRFTEDKKVYLLSGNQEQLVYDFSVEVGDTIETIVGVNCGTMLQQLLVHQVDIDDATNRKTITLYPLCQLEEDVDCDRCDENGYYLDLFPIQWIEGVGSTDGFLMGDRPCSDWVGGIGHKLLCAYKDDELQYINDLYQDDYGCEYNAVGQNPENLFPTLWGLQRTSCDEWFDGCEENKNYLFAPKEITEINGKQYLKCGGVFLREEDSKVLIYSFPYEKDLVLYDYTLEVSDTLQNLGIDIYSFPELEYAAVVDYIAYEDYDVETDEFIIKKEPLGSKRVTEVSTITLLDGKEYKRWLFGNDWENGNYYVEGIGNVGGSFGGDYINIANPYALPTCYMGEHLVCVSKNNKLLYQMDPVKMDELGAECLCDYDSGHRKDNAKDGQIGGRPTPTQWNQLEVVLRQIDNNHTILQAETFSYTLENDSLVVDNKTYFQLARQSTKDTATTKSFVGALHFGEGEDNRVYFLHNGVEYVLYDFTAEIGDTVEIFAGINNYPQDTTYTHVVTGKDTLENGACRMLLEVVFPDETTAENAEKVWLAGLGSVDGIVHNAAKRTSNAHAAPSRTAHSSDTQTSVMLCAWREDSCLYTTNHPEYDTFGCVYNQDPTAQHEIHTPSTRYQKLLRNGQLFILHNQKIYNIIGIEIK